MSFPFDSERGLVVVRTELWGSAGSIVLRLALDTGATGTLVNMGMLVAIGYPKTRSASFLNFLQSARFYDQHDMTCIQDRRTIQMTDVMQPQFRRTAGPGARSGPHTNNHGKRSRVCASRYARQNDSLGTRAHGLSSSGAHLATERRYRWAVGSGFFSRADCDPRFPYRSSDLGLTGPRRLTRAE